MHRLALKAAKLAPVGVHPQHRVGVVGHERAPSGSGRLNTATGPTPAIGGCRSGL
jgi:hypothetical protein